MDKSAELRTILPILENLTDNELQEVANVTARVILNRKNQRKKELWGNVVAAMQKYEAEIETITFMCRGEDYISWLVEQPGVIEIDD